MNARRSIALLASFTVVLLIRPDQAQGQTEGAPPTQTQQPAAPIQQQQPSQPEAAAHPASPTQQGQSFEPNSIRAWTIITDAAGPGRPARDRVQAMAALATMGNDERAARLIEEGFTAKDYDVRVAAVLAAGLTKNPKLIPALQRELDDDNPLVAYTAAMTLWKMHDTSGEDLLLAVAVGDRKAKPGLIKAERHKTAKDLHNPKTMALLTINDASGYFLGPFGVGIRAIEIVDKNSGAVPRAQAIDQLAKQHTDQVHDVLVQDLTDPEPAVRAAAAKGLGRWQDEQTENLVAPMFGDNKLPVRLTAAATYLRVANHIPTPPDTDDEAMAKP